MDNNKDDIVRLLKEATADEINTDDRVCFTVNDEQFVLDPSILLDSDSDRLCFVGGGSSGVVYRYETWDNKGTTVIIKCDKKKRKGERLCTPGWIREYIHTKDLDHKNIMKFWRKPFRYGSYFYGIMQDGGSSLKDLFFNTTKEVTPKMFCSIVQQIAHGIDYLHSPDSHGEKKTEIHGDIRSYNITMNDGGVCMLIDFGLTTKRELDDNLETVDMTYDSESDKNLGHYLWRPPG